MKDHSEPAADSWMGKSDGTWEGNALVVTTTGQNEKTWLDRAGNFHSEELKVTERFTLLDAEPHPLPSHARGSEDVLEAVDDRDAAVPADR